MTSKSLQELQTELADILVSRSLGLHQTSDAVRTNQLAAVTLQELIDESSEDAVLAFADNFHEDLLDVDDWADNFRESYCGEKTARELAVELVEEGCFGDVAPGLTYYIDYDKLARDLLMGDYWESESGHLFRSY